MTEAPELFYRRKPVLVSAWRIGQDEPQPAWVVDAFRRGLMRIGGIAWDPIYQELRVSGMHGQINGKTGDMLMRGRDERDVYPCSRSVFEATYDTEPQPSTGEIE